MKWAISCFQRVLPYYGPELDEPINHAIQVARGWCSGAFSTGDAINASRKLHTFAREIGDPVAQAVVRSVGQGVATAHMADHCMGAALYAQRAIKLAGKCYEEERKWQLDALDQIPDELSDLIRVTLSTKARGLGLHRPMVAE